MKKTKQKWCLRILVWLVAVLVLLGVADSCRVQEDPPPHTGAGQSAGTERQLDAGNRPAGRTMTADELFMEADAAMYQNKAEIKKAVGGIIR